MKITRLNTLSYVPTLGLEGSGCADIKLFGNDFSRVDKIVDFRDGSQKSAVKMFSSFK